MTTVVVLFLLEIVTCIIVCTDELFSNLAQEHTDYLAYKNKGRRVRNKNGSLLLIIDHRRHRLIVGFEILLPP